MHTYQQHYSIPESIGAEVRLLNLNYENKFLPDLDYLRSIVDDNTKMITINNPNNPSGSWIPLDVMKEIVEIARSVDAYVLCDEVYRGISEDGSYLPSIVDIYEKGVSVGSMSKCYSLAGLRLGWIVSRDPEVIRQFILKKPVARVLVNTPAALGGIGATTELFPAMTLGSGLSGKGITTDNVSPMNLVYVRRVGYPARRAGLPEGMGRSACTEGSDMEALRQMLDQVIRQCLASGTN
jgi:hypothetical protein